MTDREDTNKYMKIAAGGAAVATGLGAACFALSGQFDAAVTSTQAAIGLFGLSGMFSRLAQSGNEASPQAILVPVPIAVPVAYK